MREDESIAIVIGATGGIGRAVVECLQADERYQKVISYSRSSQPSLDLTSEETIENAAQNAALYGVPRIIFDATGFLHDKNIQPEKALKHLTSDAMLQNFLINAAGPALLMKYFLPLLPKSGRSVFASLSAKVGSISDNQIGGWHSYRASKAAQHQFIKGAAIELARTKKEAICVALHPGTVDTGLSGPFAKSGLNEQTPKQSAKALLTVMDGLTPQQTGGFFSYSGQSLPW